MYSLDVRLGVVDDHLAARAESLLSQVINEATVADWKKAQKKYKLEGFAKRALDIRAVRKLRCTFDINKFNSFQ